MIFFSKNKIKKILNYFNKNKDIDLIFDLPALKIGNKLKKNIFKKKKFFKDTGTIFILKVAFL